MSGCRSESHSHGDGDDHHHHHHGHDGHDHDGPDRGAEFSLYRQVDIDRVICLNEGEEGSGKNVFKSWEQRIDTSKFVESDADEQFTANVKLKSIAIIGAPGEAGPSKMKAFINREDVDFDSAESISPDQEWELVRDVPRGEVAEYHTRIAKFSNLRNITLYFPENFGADTTKIYYIGLKGEWMEVKKDPIITIYELAANPADHKTKADVAAGSMIQ
ncbi:PITH domain-containing protein 1 [Borealophlyctis nickersoniae]|nr:PITH domain-containing protein 1 [Borealophlyctis nickersoniae]